MSSQEKTHIPDGVRKELGSVFKANKQDLDPLNSITHITGHIYFSTLNPGCDVEREKRVYKDVDEISTFQVVHEPGRVLINNIRHIIFLGSPEYPKPSAVLEKYNKYGISHTWVHIDPQPITTANQVKKYLSCIEQMIRVIFEHIRNKENVLIHCSNGEHSMASIMAVMILLHHEGARRQASNGVVVKKESILDSVYKDFISASHRPEILAYQHPLIQMVLRRWEDKWLLC